MSGRKDILSLNCGSSSLKLKLFHPTGRPAPNELEVIAGGSVKLEKGNEGAKAILSFRGTDEKITLKESDLASPDLFEEVLSHLSSTLGSNYSLSSHLGTITHRIVHGADTPQPAVVTKGHQSRLRRMEALTAFAPLHNHVAVSVVKGCLSHLPSARNLLYFDTTFHHSLPEHVYTYPVPPTAAGQGLPGGMPFRKYGFHGLSYAYITKRVASFLGRSSSEVNLIVAHLGSGASVCAIANGKSVDTSMGLTPLEGLPGSSRSGSIDPSLPYHLIPPSSTRKEGLTTEFAGMEMARAEYVLNKESGLGAVAGIGDFGEITKRMNASGKEEGEEKRKAKLAFDLFEDRVAGYVGNYYFKLAPLGGVDALVFSGGIGEKSSELRDALADRFEGTPLAMRADRTGGEEGQAGGKEQAGVHDIAEEEKRGGKQGVRWLVCETDEEFECAQMALAYKEEEHEEEGEGEESK